ncbi:MAG: DUF4197 domain-containing protein [Bacteroidetes bacterium]|nr:DUF4197 domain-containing protein [Bacteroidota bacterium]
MKKLLIFAAFIGAANLADAQVNLKNLKNAAKTVSPTGATGLSNAEVIDGLKEALTVGANNAASMASKMDGFNKNPKIKIPFPPEANQVKTTVENMGMKKQVDKFVLTVNRAAEEAAKEAAPIFVNAIKSMSVTDGMSLLKGSDDAATRFLNDKTNTELIAKFKPVVQKAIQKVEVTRYWTPLMTSYNRVPGTQKVNPDLEEYITLKAIEGLFVLIAEEELKIRKDPSARVSDLLKKVFG